MREDQVTSLEQARCRAVFRDAQQHDSRLLTSTHVYRQNLLTFQGKRYLVAPRGLTQWVRNIRVSGEGELALGSKVERFRAVEIPDDEKMPILRAYLKIWKAEVGVFFGGVSADSSDDDLRRIAPDHPVFRVEPQSAP